MYLPCFMRFFEAKATHCIVPLSTNINIPFSCFINKFYQFTIFISKVKPTNSIRPSNLKKPDIAKVPSGPKYSYRIFNLRIGNYLSENNIINQKVTPFTPFSKPENSALIENINQAPMSPYIRKR